MEQQAILNAIIVLNDVVGNTQSTDAVCTIASGKIIELIAKL